MTYEEHIDKMIKNTKLSIEAYTYYVEYGMSLRKCAKNMCVSHTMVKNYLDDLQYIDDDMYQSYQNKVKENRKC